jgi:hypothetical protein
MDGNVPGDRVKRRTPVALLEPNPSKDAKLALVARMAHFARPGDPPLSILTTIDVHHTDQYFVQQIWILGLKDLVDSGLTKAKSAGWRFLATDTRGYQALAANVAESEGKPARMTGLSRGPEVVLALQSARQLERLPKVLQLVETVNYELRILKITGVLIEVFWLHWETNPDKDVVIPFLTHAPEQVMQVYELQPFLDVFCPLAQARLDLDESDNL